MKTKTPLRLPPCPPSPHRHIAEPAERTAKTRTRRKKGLSAAALKEMNEKLNLM